MKLQGDAFRPIEGHPGVVRDMSTGLTWNTNELVQREVVLPFGGGGASYENIYGHPAERALFVLCGWYLSSTEKLSAENLRKTVCLSANEKPIVTKALVQILLPLTFETPTTEDLNRVERVGVISWRKFDRIDAKMSSKPAGLATMDLKLHLLLRESRIAG